MSRDHVAFSFFVILYSSLGSFLANIYVPSLKCYFVTLTEASVLIFRFIDARETNKEAKLRVINGLGNALVKHFPS